VQKTENVIERDEGPNCFRVLMAKDAPTGDDVNLFVEPDNQVRRVLTSLQIFIKFLFPPQFEQPPGYTAAPGPGFAGLICPGCPGYIGGKDGPCGPKMAGGLNGPCPPNITTGLKFAQKTFLKNTFHRIGYESCFLIWVATSLYSCYFRRNCYSCLKQ